MKKRSWKHTAFALASLMAFGSMAGVAAGAQQIQAEEGKEEAKGRYLEEEVTLPEEAVTVEKVCFLSDGMAGVAAGAQQIQAEEGKEEAKGRYLEEEVTLPEEAVTVEKVCFLSDGTMRAAYRGADFALKIADSKDNGQTWDTPRDLQSEILGLADAEPSAMALAEDGGIFAVSSIVTEDPNAFLHKYHYVTPEGEVRELDGDASLGADFYAFKADFTASGNVILMGTGSLVELSMEDGSQVHTYDSASVQGFGLAGNLLISVVDETLHYYDTETGEPVSDESPLTQQVSAREENLYLTNTSSWPIVFTQQEENGILYVDRGGLYFYSKGGTVVEQLIDGSLVSIGSPMVSFLDVAAGPDGSFYLAAQDYGSGEAVGKIFRYTYHEDVSAVPSTELDVYMLTDDAFMQQAATLFQKKYPDIYVNLQTGMTGDNAAGIGKGRKPLSYQHQLLAHCVYPAGGERDPVCGQRRPLLLQQRRHSGGTAY